MIVLWQCQNDLTHLLLYAKTNFCKGLTAAGCKGFLLKRRCRCLIVVGDFCFVCGCIDFAFQCQTLLSGSSDVFQFNCFFRTVININFCLCDRRPESAGCTVVLRIGKFHIQMSHRLGIFKFKRIAIVKFCSLCRSRYTDQITCYVVQCIFQGYIHAPRCMAGFEFQHNFFHTFRVCLWQCKCYCTRPVRPIIHPQTRRISIHHIFLDVGSFLAWNADFTVGCDIGKTTLGLCLHFLLLHLCILDWCSHCPNASYRNCREHHYRSKQNT